MSARHETRRLPPYGNREISYLKFLRKFVDSFRFWLKRTKDAVRIFKCVYEMGLEKQHLAS